MPTPFCHDIILHYVFIIPSILASPRLLHGTFHGGRNTQNSPFNSTSKHDTHTHVIQCKTLGLYVCVEHRSLTHFPFLRCLIINIAHRRLPVNIYMGRVPGSPLARQREAGPCVLRVLNTQTLKHPLACNHENQATKAFCVERFICCCKMLPIQPLPPPHHTHLLDVANKRCRQTQIPGHPLSCSHLRGREGEERFSLGFCFPVAG